MAKSYKNQTGGGYEKERNKLIPAAVIFADGRHGRHAPLNNKECWYLAWNTAFLGEMDRLAKESGLVDY